MDSTRIKFDRSKFSRKRYRNSVKTLRKHLKWDGLTIAKDCKIVFKLEDQSSPLVITDQNTDYYYNTETGKLLYTVESRTDTTVPLITLE